MTSVGARRFAPSQRFYHGSWTASRAENRRICTDDKTRLAAVLYRDLSHRAAIEPARRGGDRAISGAPAPHRLRDSDPRDDVRSEHGARRPQGAGDIVPPQATLQKVQEFGACDRPSLARRQSRPRPRLRAGLVKRPYAMAAGPMKATRSIPVVCQGIIEEVRGRRGHSNSAALDRVSGGQRVFEEV
jgi:hypothetical protein